MTDFTLGVSTWCFNALAPESVRALVDGGRLYLEQDAQPALGYFGEIADSAINLHVGAIELWNSQALYQEPVLTQLRRLSAKGMVRSIHAPFNPSCDLSSPDESIRQAGVDACNRAAALLADLHGEVLTVHGSAVTQPSTNRGDRIHHSASGLAQIADYCADMGIMVAVELLADPNLGSTADELLEILRLAGRTNIGFCIDVNHVFPPSCLIETINRLGNRIIALHISDYDGITERHWLPMQGIIPWKELYKTLQSIGYRGPFLYEARFAAKSIQNAMEIISNNYAEIKG